MLPKANMIQSGNQNPQYNYENTNNQNIEEEPEIIEPEFVKETMQNGINYDEPNEVHNIKDEIIENPNNNQSIKKYNIIDLFWLIDERTFTEELPNHFADFVDISYNMDFGNLKITFCRLTEEAIDNHVVFRKSVKTLVSGTIYSSSAYRIMNSKDEISFVCMEQLINKTGESWQKQRPMIQVEKKDFSSGICYEMVIHGENSYKYLFKDWQKEALEHSLNFVYNKGFELRGQCTMRK